MRGPLETQQHTGQERPCQGPRTSRDLMAEERVNPRFHTQRKRPLSPQALSYRPYLDGSFPTGVQGAPSVPTEPSAQEPTRPSVLRGGGCKFPGKGEGSLLGSLRPPSHVTSPGEPPLRKASSTARHMHSPSAHPLVPCPPLPSSLPLPHTPTPPPQPWNPGFSYLTLGPKLKHREPGTSVCFAHVCIHGSKISVGNTGRQFAQTRRLPAAGRPLRTADFPQLLSFHLHYHRFGVCYLCFPGEE